MFITLTYFRLLATAYCLVFIQQFLLPGCLIKNNADIFGLSVIHFEYIIVTYSRKYKQLLIESVDVFFSIYSTASS
jgi:hypothetical protein